VDLDTDAGQSLDCLRDVDGIPAEPVHLREHQHIIGFKSVHQLQEAGPLLKRGTTGNGLPDDRALVDSEACGRDDGQSTHRDRGARHLRDCSGNGSPVRRDANGQDRAMSLSADRAESSEGGSPVEQRDRTRPGKKIGEAELRSSVAGGVTSALRRDRDAQVSGGLAATKRFLDGPPGWRGETSTLQQAPHVRCRRSAL
jgi:hypothetical protein